MANLRVRHDVLPKLSAFPYFHTVFSPCRVLRTRIYLLRINQGLSEELCERLAVLRGRREAEVITDTEYEELTQLTDRAEELHADRMAALVELAQLRGVSLPVLMGQLSIHFPEHA